MRARIHLSVPHMGQLEETYVREAFAQNWISTVGPNLEAFEASFSKLMGGLPCVALASGTAAIHLGLKLLGIGRDDEVLCPSLTFAASCNPIVYEGAKPVFVDSERATWNLDPALLEEVLAKKAKSGKLPRALVLVHLYGQSADLDPIEQVCAKYGVPILEDAAEALGTLYKGAQVGPRSPISIFSFNGNKIITTSGGGMLVAKDKKLVDKARFWSTQAREPSIAYEHKEVGYNYRLSNVLAGIGRGQLVVLEERVTARRAVFARYAQAFTDLPLEPMPEMPNTRHTRWLSVFLAETTTQRDAIIEALAKDDIEARPVWKPMHLQPVYVSAERARGDVAEDLFARGVCLPSSSSLSEDDQARVIEVVRRTLSTGPRVQTSSLKESPCET